MSDEQHELRLNRMKMRIIIAEKENLKLQKSDREMIELIRKIIIEEAKKIHGGTQNAD